MEEKQKNNEEEVIEEQTSTYTEPVEEKSTGAIVGVIIIVTLLVIGGLYYLESRNSNKTTTPISDATAPSAKEILTGTTTMVNSIEKQGTSDKIDAIQKDVDSTDLNNIDVGLGKINAELGI